MNSGKDMAIGLSYINLERENNGNPKFRLLLEKKKKQKEKFLVSATGEVS